MNAISSSNPINHLVDIRAAQRTAFLRDGPPTLSRRRADLKKLRAAILTRRNDIEAALNADFGHRSRHETAMMDVMSVVLGIDYLHRKLRRFMRATRRRVALPFRFGRSRSCAWPQATRQVKKKQLTEAWRLKPK